MKRSANLFVTKHCVQALSWGLMEEAYIVPKMKPIPLMCGKRQ
jgi:hypothetical protein